MTIKLEQFLRLEKGTKSVMEYVFACEHLAQYVVEYVDTEAKRMSCLLHGITTKMQDKLSYSHLRSYNELVSTTINVEEKHCLHQDAKKEGVISWTISMKLVYRAPMRPAYRPPQQPRQQTWRPSFMTQRPEVPQFPTMCGPTIQANQQPCYNCG